MLKSRHTIKQRLVYCMTWFQHPSDWVRSLFISVLRLLLRFYVFMLSLHFIATIHLLISRRPLSQNLHTETSWVYHVQYTTSGPRNLTKDRIAAADERFNRIRQVVSMCPQWRAHWRHLANTIELLLPSAHPNPRSKRQINQFSRLCISQGRVSSGTLALPGEYDWTYASFGPPESITMQNDQPIG